MSSPSVGPEPISPQGGAPEGQSGWSSAPPPPPGYHPTPSYGDAPSGYGAPRAPRPGMVTGAAVVAIVWGGLGTLFGLLALAVAFSLFPVLGLFVLLAVAVAVALLVGGIFVLQGRSPKLLLYICYAAIVINLIELIISLARNGGSAFSGVLGFVIPGVIIGLLRHPQSKQWFAERGLTY